YRGARLTSVAGVSRVTVTGQILRGNRKRGRTGWWGPFFWVLSGGVLLSHTLPGAVPSALVGLASGFGMGPGVSPPLWPPKHYETINHTHTNPHPTQESRSGIGVVSESYSGRKLQHTLF